MSVGAARGAVTKSGVETIGISSGSGRTAAAMARPRKLREAERRGSAVADSEIKACRFQAALLDKAKVAITSIATSFSGRRDLRLSTRR